MFSHITLSNATLLALTLFFIMVAPAHAYFDLGTGTYVIQLIMGFGAAFLYSARHWWMKRRAPKIATTDDSDGKVNSDGSKG